MRTETVLVALLFVAGCYVGPNLQDYGPAHSPAGINSTVTLTDKNAFDGELLSVSEDDVTLLVGEEIMRIPSSIIEKVKIEKRGRSVFIRGIPISDEALTELRPVCRFPAGVPENVLAAMLAERGQESVRIIEISGS